MRQFHPSFQPLSVPLPSRTLFHPILLIRLSHLSLPSSSFLFKCSRPAKWLGGDRTCTFLTTRSCFSPFFRRPFHSGQRARGRAYLSHEREIVRKAKGGAALEERRDNRDDEGAGGRRKEKGSTRRARSGETEIQFERCMLDPQRWFRTFRDRTFVSLRIRFALRCARRASSTAESRTRKERAGRRRGRVAGKGKGPRV